MHFVRVIFCSVLLASASAAEAAPSCKPISASAIDQMWHTYSAQLGAESVTAGAQYQCVAIASVRVVACRTRPSNPADPSIVIRTAMEKNGKVYVKTEADTAAKCDAFLHMMDQFNQLTHDTVGKLGH